MPCQHSNPQPQTLPCCQDSNPDVFLSTQAHTQGLECFFAAIEELERESKLASEQGQAVDIGLRRSPRPRYPTQKLLENLQLPEQHEVGLGTHNTGSAGKEVGPHRSASEADLLKGAVRECGARRSASKAGLDGGGASQKRRARTSVSEAVEAEVDQGGAF